MVVGVMNGGSEIADWEDWRRGDNLVQNLIGKFHDTQQWTDVVFHLSDGSQVRAHKLLLAISSSVFEAMFYGPMSDLSAMEFKVEDVKPSGFRRLVQFTYTSRCMSWKVDEPEEWWHILEAANKYLNTRLVEQVESKLREISKKEAGKGVILRHLNMANRCSFETNVKSVFLNSVIKNTSKLIQSEMWGNLDEGAIMNVYNQEFLAANEGELYVGAKSWCLRNCSTQGEALSMFLEKLPARLFLSTCHREISFSVWPTMPSSPRWMCSGTGPSRSWLRMQRTTLSVVLTDRCVLLSFSSTPSNTRTQ